VFTVGQQTVAGRLNVVGRTRRIAGRPATDQRVERRPWNRVVVERDVYDVVAGLDGHVRHRARAVPVVPAIDGRFARALDSHAQAALAGALRVDGELGGSVDRTAGQPGPAGRHLGRVAGPRARHPVLAARRFAAQRHAQSVLAHLGRREVDHVTVDYGHHVRRYRTTGRAGDHHREFRTTRFPRYHPKLLKTVDRRHCVVTRRRIIVIVIRIILIISSISFLRLLIIVQF